jgi:drug/metabolite transporter (DMT)-like permease
MADSSSINWAYGIGYSIIASIIGGASKLAIRKSYLMLLPAVLQQDDDHDAEYEEEEEEESHDDDVIHTNRQRLRFQITMINPQHLSTMLRISGMIGMTFLNPLFCVLAMNYAEPSILAPFSGLTLVWIVACSDFMIGEKPQTNQVIAAALVILGEVIVAVFGDHTNDENVSVQEVMASYEDDYFQMYFVFMMVWIVGLFYIVQTKPSHHILTRFSFGVLGGSFTGFQNFLKDSLTIVKDVQSDNDDTYSSYPWVLYLLLLCAAASSFIGLLFLTACMKRYDATFSSAMFVGSFVISASIMSAVHYQTFQHLDGIVNWILYPTGLLILMIGLIVLVNVTNVNHDVIQLYSNTTTGTTTTTTAAAPERLERVQREESLESRYWLMNDEQDVSSPSEII